MRRTSARRLATGVATLTVVSIALTACGRGEEGDGTTQPAQTAQGLSDGPATGTIQVWAMGTEGEKLGEFAKAFGEANPDATVEVTAIPWDAAHDKIATAIAGGQTPDVTMIGTTWQGEFAATGALDPTPTSIDGSAFFPGAWQGTQVGGTSYGVPWYVETRVLYYRKDMVATPPADWQGLVTMADEMKAKGAQWGYQAQARGTGTWQTFMPLAWQAGAQVTNDAGTEFTFDTPEFVEALTYYQKLFTDDVSPTELQTGELEPAFVDGRIGSFVSGPWHVGILRDAGGEGFLDKVGVAPLPTGEKDASFIGGANLAVFSDSDNRDSAWKLVQWLSEPDVQAKWYGAVNDLPAVQSAWEDPTIAQDPYLSVFGEQLETAVAPPAIPTWEQVAAVVDTELEKLTTAGADPQEVATAIQQQASSIGTGL